MNNLKLSKINIINLIILILGTFFLWLNGITYFRLIIFVVALGLIFIYKYLINRLENVLFSIQNTNILRSIITINKYRNPVLLGLIKVDVFMYNIIIRCNNKLLNYIIFALYLIVINPVKIIYYKLYKMLGIGKTSKIHNIVLNRMVGLLLSILVFTDVIIYIKSVLNINVLIVIYLYCLVISILCELIETRSNKGLNIFLVNNITTKSIIGSRSEVNIFSIILNNSNINEFSLYIDENKKKKIEAFQIGYTYYIIDSLKYFESKPNYWFYSDLVIVITKYLAMRIDSYIFFSYYKGDVPDINNKNIMQTTELFDINILKKIYEYDYMVFKTLLFLYGDIEYYLEGADYVKNTLIVDAEDLDFLSIRLNCSIKSELQFLDKIKYKEINYFGSSNGFYKIFKYDLYFKTKNSQLNIEHYKLKELFYRMVSNEEIDNLIEYQKEKIEPLYYENYIEKGYKEWYSEINQDLLLKYSKKISILDTELNSLLVFFSEL